MDILIKGMEMPVDHGFFIVICPDGTIEQKVGMADNGYPIYNIVKDAKAVALPSHGDLVERSFLKGASYEIIRFPDEEANNMFLELIDNAPTIVEASK